MTLIDQYAKQMKQWDDYKLDKELSFARAMHDESFEAVQWLNACQREANRRKHLTTERKQ